MGVTDAYDIFNTDQGSQYTSEAFTKVLKNHGIDISMDGRVLGKIMYLSNAYGAALNTRRFISMFMNQRLKRGNHWQNISGSTTKTGSIRP